MTHSRSSDTGTIETEKSYTACIHELETRIAAGDVSPNIINEIAERHEPESVADEFRMMLHPSEWAAYNAWLAAKDGQGLMSDLQTEIQPLTDEVSHARAELDATVDELTSSNPALARVQHALSPLSEHLEGLGFNLSTLRVARAIPTGLITIGGVGAAAFGLLTLQKDIEENPEHYEDFTVDNAESYLNELGLDTEVSEATLNRLRNPLATITTTAATSTIPTLASDEENHEASPEGFIPLNELIARKEEQIQTAFSGVMAYASSNSGAREILETKLAGTFLFNSSARGLALGIGSFGIAQSMNTLRTLANIPMEIGGTNLAAISVALGSLYALSTEEMREDATTIASNTGANISNRIQYFGDTLMVPEDASVLKEVILEKFNNIDIESEGGWIKEHLPTLNPEYIDTAVDYISGLTDFELNIDPERFIRAVSSGVLDILGESPEENLAGVNKDSLNSMMYTLRHVDSEKYSQTINYLNSLTPQITASNPLTPNQLRELMNISQHEDIIIHSTEGIYQWATHNEDNRLEGPFNMCIDPNLSQEEQFNLAHTYRVHTEGAAGISEMLNVPMNDIRGLANTLSEKIANGEGFISIIAGDIIWNAGAKSAVIGAASMWGEIADLMPGGDEFNLQELGVAWGDTIVPCFIIGTIPSMVFNQSITGGIAGGLKLSYRVVTTPVRVTWATIRLAADSSFRTYLGDTMRRRTQQARDAIASRTDKLKSETEFELSRRQAESRGASHSIQEMLSFENQRFRSRVSNNTLSRNIEEFAEQLPKGLIEQADSNHNITIHGQNRSLSLNTAADRKILRDYLRNAETSGLTDSLAELGYVQRQHAANPAPETSQRLQELETEIHERTQRFNELQLQSHGPTRTSELPESRHNNPEPLRQRIDLEMEASNTDVESPNHEIDVSTHNPELHNRPHTSGTVEAPSRGRHNMRRAGLAGVIAMGAAAAGVGHYMSQVNRDEIEEVNQNEISPPQTPENQELEIAARLENSEATSENTELAIIENFKNEIEEQYNPLLDSLFDPNSAKYMSEQEKGERMQELIQLHTETIQNILTFTHANKDLIKQMFANISTHGENDNGIFITDFFKLQDNQASGEVELKYMGIERFGQHLHDNFQYIKSNADALIAGQDPSQALEIGKQVGIAGASMIPVVGTGLDARDAYQAFREGRLRAGALSSTFAVVGLASDVAGVFTGGAATVAGRGALMTLRTVKTADRIMDSVDIINLVRGSLESQFNHTITI